ncbi:MAG: hypothetical protein ACTSP4_12980 [Candidatus Hodarchaeales archaeon]
MTVRTEEIPATAIKPLIEISGLEKIYLEGSPGEVKALRGVDLSIAQGEFVSIMGASGHARKCPHRWRGYCKCTAAQAQRCAQRKNWFRVSRHVSHRHDERD